MGSNRHRVSMSVHCDGHVSSQSAQGCSAQCCGRRCRRPYLQPAGKSQKVIRRSVFQPTHLIIIFILRLCIDFKATMRRLLKNKVLVCNCLSSVSFIFGLIGQWTFMPKYMETQFHQSASTAALISGDYTCADYTSARPHSLAIAWCSSGVFIFLILSAN